MTSSNTRRKKRAVTNNKTKTQKSNRKLENSRLQKSMTFIIPYLVSAAIGFFIAFFFFKLSVSKKDIIPIAQNVTEIGNELKKLRQDFLPNDDYKKYLDLYQVLYKSILETSFPGGYLTFGVRGNSIFNPGSFSNENIEVDVEGTISFNDKDCLVRISIKRIYFLETDNAIGNLSTEVNIKDYELGKRYPANTFVTANGWKQYIVILNDDLVNPVFVFGFAK